MTKERKKRAFMTWHRRSGKDKTAWNFMITQALRRKGTYYYFFPTYKQAKRVIWLGMDKDGFRFRDHCPTPELAKGYHNTELRIPLHNGSSIELIGADSYDHIMGTGPAGVVFSEYALITPRAWDFVRPMLRENDGWAVFITTPRGKNHAYSMWKKVEKLDYWYTSLLTVADTFTPEGQRVITDMMLDEERAEGMDEETLQQEYFCSWTGSMKGAYYGAQMDFLEERGKLGDFAWEPRLLVHTAWDLGIDDSMTIWMYHLVNGQPVFIDYMEGTGQGIQHYIKLLRELPYTFGTHLAPHDIENRDMFSGITRKRAAQDLGFDFTVVDKPGNKEDAIDATRGFLPKCQFDATRCERGIDALRSFRKEWDDENQVFRNTPVHDWASHAADAMQTAALGFHKIIDEDPAHRKLQTVADGSDFDVYDYESDFEDTFFD